jgi:hypothetical protein
LVMLSSPVPNQFTTERDAEFKVRNIFLTRTLRSASSAVNPPISPF